MKALIRVWKTILQKIRFGQVSKLQAFDCKNQDADWWQERARQAAALWIDTLGEESVTKEKLQIGDFGCGDQKLRLVLKTMLGAAGEYHGYDLHPQSEDVEFCDLEEYIPTGPFDVIFCLGVFEYIRNVEHLLARMRRACRYAVISFVNMNAERFTEEELTKRGWLSKISPAEFSDKLTANGFTIVKQILINDDTTTLWLLQVDSHQDAHV